MPSRLENATILLTIAILVAAAGHAAPIGTAFNYQGFLKDDGAPASGRFDFKFNLLDSEDPLTASELESTIVLDVEVIDGLFVTSVDFGDAFDGSAVWLEIEVRPAGFGGLTTLYPPHPLHAIPYSVEASRLEGLAASDFVTAEADPTVPSNLKDGVAWSELQDIPPDFADGVDNGPLLECYETDWGGRSPCAFNAGTLYEVPTPPCDPGFTFMGLAQITIANTDCNNWTANVRLQARSRCCRIQ